MDKPQKLNLWYLAVALVAIFLVQQFVSTPRKTEKLSYTQFEQLVAAGDIATATATDHQATGRYKKSHAGRSEYVVTRVDPALADSLAAHGVEVTGGIESNLLATLLSWIVPAAVFFGIWFFAFRRIAERTGGSGLLSIGKSRAKIDVEKDTNVTFDDVAGAAEARKQAPAIIFIDELDSLGRARSIHGALGGNDEREQTLNQLHAELDGFDPREGVVLLSATNRPEILDPALLRAGRFDRQILIDRPDKRDRVEIVKAHTRKVQLAADVDADGIAAMTPGFTGADLANLVNEAALLATRRKAASVSLVDFTQAIERIVAGIEKRNRLLIPREREIVAHHAMGRALVALATLTGHRRALDDGARRLLEVETLEEDALRALAAGLRPVAADGLQPA